MTLQLHLLLGRGAEHRVAGEAFHDVFRLMRVAVEEIELRDFAYSHTIEEGFRVVHIRRLLRSDAGPPSPLSALQEMTGRSRKHAYPVLSHRLGATNACRGTGY